MDLELDKEDVINYGHKEVVAEDFFRRYTEIHAADVYRWLWEGEFGPGATGPQLTLDRLTDDLRLARMFPHKERQKICENLGLAGSMLKVNIVPYVDSGCPFKRLLVMAERVRDVPADPLRFKRDWAFMKAWILRSSVLRLEEINNFENRIAFHLTPEVGYSERFLQNYSVGYRVVPKNLFFHHFPEYTSILSDASQDASWDRLDTLEE